MEKNSILSHINLEQVGEITQNTNIFVSQFTSPTQFSGLHAFSKLKSRFKLVLFYDENLPTKHINRLKSYTGIILCKYSNSSNLYRFIPIIKSDLNFEHAFICEIKLSRFSWMYMIKLFENVIKSQMNNNTYIIQLAGNLIPENIELEYKFNIKTWYRISKNYIIIKKNNEFPIELLENAYVNSHSDTQLTLSMMQYIQDNKIEFNYKILQYGNRIPIYYWLEIVKPSQNVINKFLTLMGSVDTDINCYIKQYEFNRRRELYSLINKNIKDLSFFEDPKLIKCIRRIITYFNNNDNIIYNKKW